MVTSGIGALFNGEPRAPPPPPPPCPQPRARSQTHPIYANWANPGKYDNMQPDHARLKELKGIEVHKDKRPQRTSRTSDEDFVLKTETSSEKRKYDEITRMQILHRQPAIDAARAVDMDDIHFDEPFQGFTYAASHNNSRYGPPLYDAFDPPNHPAHGGHAFCDESFTYGNTMCEPSDVAHSLSGDTLVPQSFVPGFFDAAEPLYTDSTEPFFPGSFDNEPTYTMSNHAFSPCAAGSNIVDVADDYHEGVKQEESQGLYSVSATPTEDSEFAASESEDGRPRKAPKLNKDGIPRKPRQPRPKLLKWSDDDWKNVCLGIVWACGEIGVSIPFDQAAQIVGEKCTAGALQQALLKLRGKQIAAGHSIPSLKMGWTRKNKPVSLGTKAKASAEPEANKPRKKPTRFEATQSLIVTLPRAYTDQDREGLPAPYRLKKPPRRVKSANIKQDACDASYPSTPGAGQHLGYLPSTPPMSDHFYNTPPVTPFSNNVGYLQGMVIGGGEYARLLTTEGLHEVGNGWGDAADDVFN